MECQVDEETFKRLVQEEAMKLPDTGVVASGISCRFPKSDTVNEFEQNLYEGKDMITENDDARFPCGLWGLPTRGGRLNDLSRFDSEFFGYTLEEADFTDYQVRILFEVVYESILDAGINPASLRGTNTGVFLGYHCVEFEIILADDPRSKTGFYGQVATQISQYFDLRGKTACYDAACASSFIALHNARQAISDGVVDRAIVCSVNIPIHPSGYMAFFQMQMLSPTGYSRFCDAKADGYVRSEACCSVLLQREDIALRCYGNFLLTLNSVDGYKKEGITFPSFQRQEDLMRDAKKQIGLSANQIEYFEAHGTGTPAGDPQETRAIANVYAQMEGPEADDPRKLGPLLVGSVKTSIGHSEGASGVSALIKCLLMLENEVCYQNLHFESPNPNIEALKEGRVKVPDHRMKLTSRIIPMSCYGFGGANAHAIIRANPLPAIAPELTRITSEFGRIVVMFGRSKEAVNAFFDKILDTESRSTKNCLSDDFLQLVDALSQGKMDRLMNYRGYLVVDRETREELARGVRKCELPHLVDVEGKGHHQECTPRKCHLFMPGLGSEWAGMAAGLEDFEPFWSTIERLEQVLKPHQHNLNLRHLLTNLQQPLTSIQDRFVAITAYQIALINMLKQQLQVANLGNFVGHSLGEFACAYAAQVIDEKQTILLAYHIGSELDQNKHLMQGRMVACAMKEDEAELVCSKHSSVAVSCVNGPSSVTISGSHSEMDLVVRELDENEIRCKVVDSSVTLHNKLMMGDKMRNQLEIAASKALAAGELKHSLNTTAWKPSVETSSGNRIDARLFAELMCNKVDILRSLNGIEGSTALVEVGPCGLFESQITELVDEENRSKFHYVSLMKRSSPAENQKLELFKGIGCLYQAGVTLNLTHFHTGKKSLGPVRKQTPSLSSLLKWNHERTFFVPRYPNQFGKSAAKTEIPIDVMQDRDKYLRDHCIEGRNLLPATAYLFLVWRVFSFTKRNIFDCCYHSVENDLMPIEFHDVRLMRAVILSNQLSSAYIHLEEGSGRFEVREDDSVIVHGYVRSPTENPTGLLYSEARERVEKENLDLVLTSDDIYKQFRVSGYDYGEKFQNIQAASADGRRCRIAFNGHFIALTDNILQTLFLAVSEYAPSGGLFLPTFFEYVRFQPGPILEKIKAAGMAIDFSDSALSTEEKRKTLITMMQRDDQEDTTKDQSTDEEKKPDSEVVPEEKPEEPKKVCVFETFCDTQLGVVVTDGMEFRGLKATPAPRRFTDKDVLLESYQFIRDIEIPVQDELLTRLERVNNPYIRVCNSMSIQLLNQLSAGKLSLQGLIEDETKGDLADESEIDKYKKANLPEIYSNDTKEKYDIKKNGNKSLLSTLDKLTYLKTSNPDEVRDTVAENRVHLINDLIQESHSNERMLRPVVEIVLENAKKSKVRTLEINLDDGIMRAHLQSVAQLVAPQTSLDYDLAHPEPTRLTKNKAAANVRTHTLKTLPDLFTTQKQLKDLDLILYKDISCYSLPKQVVEQNGLGSVLSSLNTALRPGGFALVLMRHRLTFAERVLLALSKPELVGLSKEHLEGMSQDQAQAKIASVNGVLADRCELMLAEGARNNMQLVSRKVEPSGCTLLLFRRKPETQKKPVKSVVLQVLPETCHVADWLERLKAEFKKDDEAEETETEGATSKDETQENKKKKTQQEKNPEEEEDKRIWLCAVATRDHPHTGLFGMMRALTRELGPDKLRCFYDAYTFAHRTGHVDTAEIEASNNFRDSLEADLMWNCFDEAGRRGAYRHMTINSFMNYEDCLCAIQNQPGVVVESTSDSTTNTSKQVVPAFVNTSKRGDLSSFTWFELPLKHLDNCGKERLVKVAYAALNFRDVMFATGRLPPEALPLELATSDCLIGFEFSGIDSRNRRIAGMTSLRGLATHVLPVSEMAVLEVPDGMSLRDAATIPVVYATVILSIVYRAKAKRGESILIHAGAGGVGQAAIRVAAYYGLKIYATVGSAEKRKFLLEEFPDFITDDCIFNSRDTSFETDIMRVTQGQGVDIVLNSLAEDKLEASIRCLSDGGRFLELGKYDLVMNTRLELTRLDHNKTFHGVLLDKLFEGEASDQDLFMSQMQEVFKMISHGFQNGYIKPIKSTVFEPTEVEEAFRFMATGKHIGKVLIAMDPELDSTSHTTVQQVPSTNLSLNYVPQLQFSKDKSCIVTGALGGFGVELVKWLARQGVRHMVLTSRSGVRSGYQRIIMRRLEAMGVRVHLLTSDDLDSSTQEGAEKLCAMAQELAPTKQIAAIFHLAMVLRDSLLENMTVQDFEAVCKPKLIAGQHLDTASRKYKPDYFVVFSSVSSGKGNGGQMNYAYANSYLEHLCESRRKAGLHALAVQWGAIGDVGVAFNNFGGNDVVIGGTKPQRIPSCFHTLGKLMTAPFTTALSVVPVNRSTGSVGESGSLVEAIMHVLGIKDASKVREEATLAELGLDSLMAVEIRQYIEREYDITMNMQEIRSLTIAKIREIDESGKPSDAAAAHKKQVGKAAGGKAAKEDTTIKAESYGSKATREAIKVDKKLITAFTPPLELPKEDYCMLNSQTTGKPIFFIPPIHGTFDNLLCVCNDIKRPCVGLNWTLQHGKSESTEEVVKAYVDLLHRLSSGTNELNLKPADNQHENDERHIDLVGYSYGATIAFEIMLVLHKQKSTSPLKPGKLTLLDGSPKMVELGTSYLTQLTQKENLELEQKVDEVLMAFIMAHAREAADNYDEIRDSMSALDLDKKFVFAAETLTKLLIKRGKFQEQDYSIKRIEIANSMEAFARKYDLINDYKSRAKLPDTCLLIRAEKLYIKRTDKNSDFNQDLGVKEVVEGRVNLHVMAGDHQSFLTKNASVIAGIIGDYVSQPSSST